MRRTDVQDVRKEGRSTRWQVVDPASCLPPPQDKWVLNHEDLVLGEQIGRVSTPPPGRLAPAFLSAPVAF